MMIVSSIANYDPFIEYSLNELNETLIEKDKIITDLLNRLQTLENEIKAIYSYLNIDLYKLSAEIKAVNDFNRLYNPFKDYIEIHKLNAENCYSEKDDTKDNIYNEPLHSDPTKINIYVIEYGEIAKQCNYTIDYFTVSKDKLVFDKFPSSVNFNLKIENGSLYVDTSNYDTHILILQPLGQGNFDPEILFIH
jgi:hypothetical protein